MMWVQYYNVLHVSLSWQRASILKGCYGHLSDQSNQKLGLGPKILRGPLLRHTSHRLYSMNAPSRTTSSASACCFYPWLYHYRPTGLTTDAHQLAMHMTCMKPWIPVIHLSDILWGVQLANCKGFPKAIAAIVSCLQGFIWTSKLPTASSSYALIVM